MGYLLEIKGLTIKYKKHNDSVTILDDADFSIKSGGITLLLGNNGTGKSTIFKALTHDPNFNGYCQYKTCVFDNNITQDMSNIRDEIVYVQQSSEKNDFVMDMPRDELYLVAKISKKYKDSTDIDKQIDELIKYFDSEHEIFVKKKIKALSGGQRQILNILTGLIKKPRLLILDEPVNNLDSRKAILLNNYLLNYIKEYPNNAIVIITHCRMFPKVLESYEIKNEKLGYINYEYQRCFGTANDVTGQYSLL